MPSHYFFHCSKCDFEAYRYRNFKTCPKCRAPMIREEPVDFRPACWVCGSRSNLEMFAHRNEKQQMVGWLFVCGKHTKVIADQDLIIEVISQAATVTV